MSLVVKKKIQYERTAIMLPIVRRLWRRFLSETNSHYERGTKFDDGGFRISHIWEANTQRDVPRRLLAVNTDDAARLRRCGEDRQWDLILPSNARSDNMILSSGEERVREGKQQTTTAPRSLERSTPVSAAHRPAARSPCNVVTQELPEDKRRMPLSMTRRGWYVPACVALSDNYIFVSSRREDGGSTRPTGAEGGSR